MIPLGLQRYIMSVDSFEVVMVSFGVLVVFLMSGHKTLVEVSNFVTDTVCLIGVSVLNVV